MAYKSLGDRNRRNALPHFLNAADHLTGIVCTIAVDKSYRWMGTSPNTIVDGDVQNSLAGKWGSPAFENMSRITLFWSVILGCISKEGQDVSWITGEDEIAANDDRLTDLLNWAGRLSSIFCSGPMGTLAVNTTAIDTSNRGFEDFVAISDLCAGAFAELTSTADRISNPNRDELPRFIWESARAKADYLIDWYYAQTGLLRKVAIIITREGDNHYMVQRILPES